MRVFDKAKALEASWAGDSNQVGGQRTSSRRPVSQIPAQAVAIIAP